MQLMGDENKFSGGSIIGDICDLEHLTDCVQESQSEIIFHLAAQPIVRRSFDSTIKTFETNLMGTVHLLETMKQATSPRVAVIVTSDKCYNNLDVGMSFTEDSPLGGDDPYSASKACAEIATQSFIRSFFTGPCNGSHQVKIATARAGNIIGGGDWGEDRLIPDIVRAIRSGEEIQIRSPQAIRPWQFVLDALSGYLMLAERLYSDGDKFVGAWNFGPGSEHLWTVKKVVQKFCIPGDPKIEFKGIQDDTKKEKKLLNLDTSKANRQLSWAPKVPITTFLPRTRVWYEKNCQGTAADLLCKQELDYYQTFKQVQ